MTTELQRLDVAEVAKRVRAAIRAAQKAGTMPGAAKVSVTTDRFSMGCRLDVSVTAFPHVVLRPAHVLWVADNPHECFVTAPRDVVESHTPIALRFLAVLDAMVRLYHRSDCDSQRDHFDVNFWFHGADFATALEQRQRARILEANGRDVPSYLSRFVGNVTP